MFNLFKKQKPQTKQLSIQNDNFYVVNSPKEDVVKNIVKDIHDDFYSEVDRLLESTGVFLKRKSSYETTFEKAERLKKIGFESSKIVKDAKQISNEIKTNESIKNAIIYFSQKYPHYKFITEDSVKSLCKKYGLIYGDVKHFKGDVPEKNLEQIEKFSIHKEDMAYYNSRWDTDIVGYDQYKIYEIKEDDPIEKKTSILIMGWGYYAMPFEIVGNEKDFDTSSMRVSCYKLMDIPDPIVLQPVFYEGKKHYLIVTAWGDESSDELVVNEKMN